MSTAVFCKGGNLSVHKLSFIFNGQPSGYASLVERLENPKLVKLSII